MMKILWKKNGIWLLLIPLLLMLINMRGFRTDMLNFQEDLEGNCISFLTEKETADRALDHLASGKPMETFQDYASYGKIQGQLKKDHPEGISPKEVEKIREEYEVLLKEEGLTRKEFQAMEVGSNNPQTEKDWRMERLRAYKEFLRSLDDLSYTGMSFSFDHGEAKIDVSRKVFSHQEFLLYAFAMALMFTSMEFLTNFHDFTGSYPWSRGKTFFAKTVLGLGLLLLFWAITAFLRYRFYEGLPWREFILYKDVTRQAIYAVAQLVGNFLLMMGIGAFAGNFLGHLGLMIVVYGGVYFYLYLIGEMISIFQLGKGLLGVVEQLLQKIDHLPELVKTLLSPANAISYEPQFMAALGIVLVGIMWFVFGTIYVGRIHGERKKLFVLEPRLSKFAEILGVLTSASMLTNIVTSISRGLENPGWITVPVGILSLVLMTILFRKLFRIRLGV